MPSSDFNSIVLMLEIFSFLHFIVRKKVYGRTEIMTVRLSLLQQVSKLLTASSEALFVRPPCSTRLIQQFEDRIRSQEIDSNKNSTIGNDSTQVMSDFLILRKLIDANQNQLQKMNRLGAPKSERAVMESIARRVGFEMPKPQHLQNQKQIEDELKYYFDRFNFKYEEFNTSPINHEDYDHEKINTDEI